MGAPIMRSVHAVTWISLIAMSIYSVARLSCADGKPVRAAKPRTRIQFTVSKKTTYLTAPLRKDGTVDYITSLNRHYGKDATPENNAAVPFLRAFGPAGIPKELRSRLFKFLGIKPLSERGPYFLDPVAWARRERPRNAQAQREIGASFDASQTRPWKSSQFPHVAAWLDAMEEPLEAIAEAARRPRWFLPIVLGDDVRSTDATDPVGQFAIYQPMRQTGRTLRARAMLNLGEGRVAEALTDLLTIQRLGNLLEQDPLLLSSLLASAVSAYSFGAEVHVAHSAKLTAAEARRYCKELDRLGRFKRSAGKFEYPVRCLALHFVADFAKSQQPQDRLLSLFPRRIAKAGGFAPDEGRTALRRAIRNAPNLNEVVDWDFVLRRFNAWYDGAARVAETRDPVMLKQNAAVFQEKSKVWYELPPGPPEFLKRKTLSRNDRKQASQWMAAVLLDRWQTSILQVRMAEERANAHRELVRVAFALAASQTDHGKYPDKLKMLVPRNLPKLPSDPFSHRPFQYLRSKTGYLLYSVGMNGVDDGGRSFYDRLAGYLHDDIAVRTPAK
jgi:hypothetical protein